MKEITKEILEFRDCVTELWNNYFLKVWNEDRNLTLDCEYCALEEKILEMSFNISKPVKNIELTTDSYYDEIVVVPGLNAHVLHSSGYGKEYKLVNMPVNSPDDQLRFSEIYAESMNSELKGGKLMAILTESEQYPELIGHRFILSFKDVKFYFNG